MWHSQDSNLNLTGSQTMALFICWKRKKHKGRNGDREARRRRGKKDTKNIF